MPFSVPKPVRPVLVEIAKIDNDAFKSAIRLLEEMPVMVSLSDVERFSTEHEADLPPQLFQSIARSSISLAYGRSSMDLDTSAFVEQVLKSAQEFPELKEANVDIALLKSRLTELLSISSLTIAAKAATIAFETERHAVQTRILTDARPVFGKTIAEDPVTWVIMHHLKIDYHEYSEDDVKGFFISLDVDDLKTLRDTIERALEKETRLRGMLKPTGAGIAGLPRESDS